MNALSIFKAILAVLEPVALQQFDAAIIPELQSLVASDVTSPDLKVILNSMIAALKAIGDAEIPKV